MKNEKYDNYITQKQAGGKIVSPNKSYGSRGERYANQDEEFMSRYNYADDYLMSEGENAFESTVKGMTNRARSAVGTGAEDFAYFLYDNIPEYKPAKTVLNNKTASIISEKADSQFADAKANTGAIGDKIIDIADESAEMLGYSMFGPKALYVFATAEGFGEYRSLREQGYSEIDSFIGALGKAGYTVAAEKVDDYIGKNNPIDDYLLTNYIIYRKLDSDNVKKYNDIRLGKQEYARVASAVGTYHPNKKGYVEIILDNGNGDPAIRYYVFVNDDSTITILGKEGTKNIHEGAREYYEGK